MLSPKQFSGDLGADPRRKLAGELGLIFSALDLSRPRLARWSPGEP